MGLPETLMGMVHTWTDTQQRVWSTWLRTMQGIGKAPTPDLRGTILSTWQDSINQTLEAQAQWIDKWVESLNEVETTPEAIKSWVAQSQSALIHWNKAQQQLWEQLFDVLKKAEPEATVTSIENQGMEVFRAWQKSVHTMMGNAVGKTSPGKRHFRLRGANKLSHFAQLLRCGKGYIERLCAPCRALILHKNSAQSWDNLLFPRP